MEPHPDGNPLNVEKNVTPQTKFELFHAFLFWTTVLALVMLLIGFVTPGWLCVNVNTWISPNHDIGYYSQRSDVEHVLVYENYGLWYMTQCKLYKSGEVCETRSYYLLNSVDNREKEPLVFSYSALRNIEIMYTTALTVLLYILYSLYCVRKRGQNDLLSILRWVCLSVFAFISGVLVTITVHVFKQKGFKFGDEKDHQLKRGLAINFGGAGAAACFLSMACMIAILFMKTQDCSASSDTSAMSQAECVQPQTTGVETKLQQKNENVNLV